MGIREVFAVTVNVFSFERLRDSGINEVYILFSIKYYLKKLNLINSVVFLVISIIDFNRAWPPCYSTIFLTPIRANKMRLLHIHCKYYALLISEANSRIEPIVVGQVYITP